MSHQTQLAQRVASTARKVFVKLKNGLEHEFGAPSIKVANKRIQEKLRIGTTTPEMLKKIGVLSITIDGNVIFDRDKYIISLQARSSRKNSRKTPERRRHRLAMAR